MGVPADYNLFTNEGLHPSWSLLLKNRKTAKSLFDSLIVTNTVLGIAMCKEGDMAKANVYNRWPPQPISWATEAPALVSAVRDSKVALIVGNGVSRLADPPAPSWTDLFGMPIIEEALQREGISVKTEMAAGASLLELAEALKQDRAAWSAFLNRLKQWSRKVISPSLVHRILAALDPLTVLTTNVDKLLEPPAFKKKPAYLHGDPDDPSKWVFTLSEYLKKENYVRKLFRKELDSCQAALFVGYGHAFDDFDIIRALHGYDNWEL